MVDSVESIIKRTNILSAEQFSTKCATQDYIEKHPEAQELYNGEICRKIGEALAII